MISKAAVIGSGIMGYGISQLMASQGIRVSLVDTSQPVLDWVRSARWRLPIWRESTPR